MSNLPNVALITPYDELSAQVTRQAVGKLNCHTFHGSLETAAAIAKNFENNFYDVIISRGGTADYIKKATDIPVVSILTSALDLLRAILPYKDKLKKIAFFNYQTHLLGVEDIAATFNIQIDEYIFTNVNDIESLVESCINKNYDLLVGGAPVKNKADKCHLKSVIIENGTSSIEQALRETLAIIETKKRQNSYMARLEIILSSISEGIIVTDINNEILFINKSAESICNINMKDVLGKNVDQVLPNSRINQVLLSKSPEIGELQELVNTSIITSRVPIFMGGECIGVVCSFKDTPQIEKAERIIRGKMKKRGFTAKYRFNDIFTQDEHVKELIKFAKIYASTQSPIMIYGESGTGKELFAQSIHNASDRKEGPFIAINCAAIPESLLESELFGYEGGAFTGAKREGKAGLIELAHDGTLFLDEIGELPLHLQSRLLRVLQEYEIMRIGGNDVIPVNIRIIGATNKNLSKLCEANQFRTDLYHRINILPLTIPPLRERGNDVYHLAKKFLNNSKEEYRLERFINVFSQYQWPGNIRELKSIIERLSLLSSHFPKISWVEILTITDFEFKAFQFSKESNHPLVIDLSQHTLKEMINDIEHKIILFYLELYEENQDKVADKLGISRMSLWRKLNKN